VLDAKQRKQLLKIARSSLERHLGREPAEPPPEGPAVAAGAFVTLRTRTGRLRGCIGRTSADRRVDEVVARMAVAAGTEDPRFPPIDLAELDALEIEVSVLGPLMPCEPDDVQIGRDGLVVERGWSRGLLLPQVATEQGWGRLEFLDATCRKAGLEAGAWRHGASLQRFEAAHFAEGEE
jgi:AmmeMemoRadiSam system protein A